MIKTFSQKTKESIQFYVYCLIDPRDCQIFYIGKGVNDRVFQHAQDALEVETETDKLDTIRKIISSGSEVQYYILRHGLSEQEALLVESCYINLFRFQLFQTPSKITNIVAGHDTWDRGIKTTDDIEIQYAAQPVGQINHKVLIVNTNKTYKSGVSLYDATRQEWKIDIKRVMRAMPDMLVFGEYRSIIRGIFQPLEWCKRGKRYYFDGIEVSEEYPQYLNKQTESKKKGQRNPVQYVNM